ncbi:outer membrane efflux protein [Chitinophaga niastensis]|uniref:Outer membrane efflux protein n=1 Tax=Chitinophaga niastensis TaxID=536980 RepID=A0A2P8HC45_CHINA|nr:TolC family protein [Chitinophaga niastensis]PSL43752.1 outer membrane efflux protein [Chitinophaga niastensis]
MKKVFFVIVSICFSVFAQAQDKASSLYLKLNDAPEVTRLKAKLVQLAMENPGLSVFDAKREINSYEVTKAKAAWLNTLTAAGNLNEYTIKNQATSNNAFFPRYNFSLMIPLGNFITIPNDVKIAKTNKKVINYTQDEARRKLKADVLDAYEQYASAKKLLELQAPLLEDVLTQYKQIEEKFSKGEKGITVEEYNTAYRNYNGEMVRKVMVEKELRLAKNEVERLIGISLEEAILQSQAEAGIK